MQTYIIAGIAVFLATSVFFFNLRKQTKILSWTFVFVVVGIFSILFAYYLPLDKCEPHHYDDDNNLIKDCDRIQYWPTGKVNNLGHAANLLNLYWHRTMMIDGMYLPFAAPALFIFMVYSALSGGGMCEQITGGKIIIVLMEF